MIPFVRPSSPSGCLGRASASGGSSRLAARRRSTPRRNVATRRTRPRARTSSSSSPDVSSSNNKSLTHGRRPDVHPTPRPAGHRGRTPSYEGHKASRGPRPKPFPCLSLHPARPPALCAAPRVIQIQPRRTAEMPFFVRRGRRLERLVRRHQNVSRTGDIFASLLYKHNMTPSLGPRENILR